MRESASILAVGDIHLGTRCSGIPDDLIDLGVDKADLSPAAGLEKTVKFAIDQGVSAVLLAGDVVENKNARFEALVPLENSVKRLVNEGIEVIAVAGNHDVEALPRLAALIDGFTLLGANGNWDSKVVIDDGKPIAEIVGWSFPDQVVRESPLVSLINNPLPRIDAATPRLGLLHADLTPSGKNYAPIKQSELDSTRYDAWFLGHIHKPSLVPFNGEGDTRKTGYLGSLVSLDPSETGCHGPWLIEFDDNRDMRWRQVPLSPVRWERMDVSVDGIDEAEDVPDQILREVESFARQLSDANQAPEVLGLRVRLVGASVDEQEIRRLMSQGKWSSLCRRVDDIAVFVEQITDAMDPYINLSTAAEGDDPIALLARRILSLQKDGDDADELIRDARERLKDTTEKVFWGPLNNHRSASDPLSDEAVRDLLLRSGKAALTSMIAEKGSAENQ